MNTEKYTLTSSQYITTEQILWLVTEEKQIAITQEDEQILLKNALLFQQKAADKSVKIYGTTTGFGPFVEFSNPDSGIGLLTHLSAGAGDITPQEIIRATILLRIRTLLNGHSAISLKIINKLLVLYNSYHYPEVPQIGSLGASGDLIPLSYCALPIFGIGELITPNGGRISAQQFWENNGGALQLPSAREALALTNGTSYSTAYALFALRYTYSLVEHTEKLVGGLYNIVRARKDALHPELHAAKLHKGSIIAAQNIQHRAGEYIEDSRRPLQEIYSLRCAPQILGAIRDTLHAAEQLINNEINGTDDNPLSIADGDNMQIIHGGNFYGQHIAFASDMLSMCIVKLSLYAERLIAFIAEPKYTSATPLLAAEPGADSGIAGLQLTATALAAEIRSGGVFHSVATIPTNGNNQDIVSMSALAARKAYEKALLASSVVAATEISLLRLSWLLRRDLPEKLSEIPTMQHSITDSAYRQELQQRAERILPRKV